MTGRRPALALAVAAAALILGGGGLLTSWLMNLAGKPSQAASADVLPEVPATPMDRVAAVANNSPTLAADPTDRRFVAMAHRIDAPDFGCALQVSGDGGRGWIATNPVQELPEGSEKCYNPEVAFDADGALFYLFVGLAGRGNEPVGVFLTRSEDRGQSFSEPIQVLGPANFSVRMAMDQNHGEAGRMHLVWLHARTDPPLGGFGPPPNPILAAYSDDGGRSFSEPVQVNHSERLRVAAPALALGPTGDVHVAYYDLGDDAVDYQGLEGEVYSGTWSVMVSSSTDGGATFGTESVADDGVVPTERVMLIFTMPPPALVAGPERLCVAWTDGRHGDADAVGSCSAENGRRFGEVVRLNDDPLGNGRSQYQPRLSMAPGGRLDVIFYDRRNSLQNINNQVFYTFSTDGGATFASNMVVSGGDPSFIRIGPEYAIPSAEGLVEFGSRMGLLSAESSAVAAWTDTRNALEFTTDQDIFTSKVIRLPTQLAPINARAAGGVVLLLAGVILLVVRRRIVSSTDPAADE